MGGGEGIPFSEEKGRGNGGSSVRGTAMKGADIGM